MSNVQKYLQDAQRGANQQFSNFNGGGRGNGYSNFTGSNPGQPFYSADGSGMAPAAQSSPYVITISNSTGNAVPGFQIFGAWTYLVGGGTFTNGSFTPTNTGVTISGLFSNVTYQYLLQQSSYNPFSIGSTQLITTVNASQANVPMQVGTTDANGDSISKQIIWATNPFQNQNGNVINNTQYRIDGSTTITTTILPGAVYNLYFYPMMNVDNSRNLVNAAPAQQFGNPGLQPANTVVIPSAAGTTIVNRLRS